MHERGNDAEEGGALPMPQARVFQKKTDEMVEQTYIIPHAESEGALAELEETMALPGLKMFFIAMTDASKVITQSKTPDWYHKKLWEYLAGSREYLRRRGWNLDEVRR